MIRIANIRKMPGRSPRHFSSRWHGARLFHGRSAQQAAQPTVQPPPSVRPTPGQLELSKLIWSTVAAVDHANRSGNYSVLRDISAQGFQINNNAAQLGQIFAGSA